MIYLKTMNWLKKFWIIFLSFLPSVAGAVSWFAIIGGGIGLVGFSIYRTMAPVNMNDALKFFSSCWTCQMFSDIMATMSRILPNIYDAIGGVVVPFAITLTAVWFAWQVFRDFINDSTPEPWSMASKLGNHLAKLACVSALLLAPLPRMITQIAIEPIFNIGLATNRLISSGDSYDTCVIATALADPIVDDSLAAKAGAFSPKFRHNLTCEVASVHQLTGLGMTIGWTMVNMAFNSKYMHKIMWDIPIFPNLILIVAGALIIVLFMSALLPIPLYFLEIFITLALDMVMLPLMLLAWLFQGWAISLPGAGKTIRNIVDNVINGTLGIAVTGIFISFAIMFLDAVFGGWSGASVLADAIAKNDSQYLMDALMLHNDSLVTIILMGIFFTMFMISIPALCKTLFNVSISTKYYDTAKNDAKILWGHLKNWYDKIKK